MDSYTKCFQHANSIAYHQGWLVYLQLRINAYDTAALWDTGFTLNREQKKLFLYETSVKAIWSAVLMRLLQPGEHLWRASEEMALSEQKHNVSRDLEAIYFDFTFFETNEL